MNYKGLSKTYFYIQKADILQKNTKKYNAFCIKITKAFIKLIKSMGFVKFLFKKKQIFSFSIFDIEANSIYNSCVMVLHKSKWH